jgi:acetyl esterase/lipase
LVRTDRLFATQRTRLHLPAPPTSVWPLNANSLSRSVRDLLVFFTFFTVAFGVDAEVRVVSNLPYKIGAALSEYESTRCKLDLYSPIGVSNCPVLVWFHGGGLKEGSKEDKTTIAIARHFANLGLAVAVPNYRLSPKATFPAYVDDAAAAVAWTCKHAAEHGLDVRRVFVGGHSAGGYLTAMVGIDPQWLRAYDMQPASIAGLIPLSGQMMTHYTVREERGITNKLTIIADAAAPIHHARKDTPPWLILFADNDMATRADENLYFASVLRASGNSHVEHKQITNRTHNSIASQIAEPNDPVADAILRFTGVSR